MSEKSFIHKLNKIADANAKMPLRLGARAVLFSKNRFRQQNWVDKSVEPWEARKHNKGSRQRKKRGVLIDTGRLFRSIRKIYVSQNSVIIGTDVPYARAHNEGFKGTVQVKAHTRGVYEKTKYEVYNTRTRRSRTVTKQRLTGAIKVKAHSKKMNLPKRQFMGASSALSNRLSKMIINEYKKALR